MVGLVLFGLILALLGFISIIKPLKVLKITSRFQGVLMLVVGLVLFGYTSNDIKEQSELYAKQVDYDSVSQHKEAKVKDDAVHAQRDAEIASAAGFDDLVEYRAAHDVGIASKVDYDRHVEVERFFTLPSEEKLLIAAVHDSRSLYRNAETDLAKGGVRSHRKSGVCDAIASFNVKNWVGKISKLSSNSDGKGVLAIELAEDVTFKTLNNSHSDISLGTLIKPSSRLFQKVATLKEGQRVRFSGQLFSDDIDCIREGSLSLAGSMTAPEYIMRFVIVETP